MFSADARRMNPEGSGVKPKRAGISDCRLSATGLIVVAADDSGHRERGESLPFSQTSMALLLTT